MAPSTAGGSCTDVSCAIQSLVPIEYLLNQAAETGKEPRGHISKSGGSVKQTAETQKLENQEQRKIQKQSSLSDQLKQLQQQLKEKCEREEKLQSELKEKTLNEEELKSQLERTRTKLKEETDRRLELQKKFDKAQSAQLERLTDGEPVYGVTSLDNLLFLLRGVKTSDQVEVYDTDSYCLRRCISVPGLRMKCDMIACAHNVCLYISGSNSKCVHRVALPACVITQWPVNDVAGRLSLTGTHTVLVTCREVGKIKEFDTYGELLREVTLPQDVVSPWHSIQLPSGNFVVCHGHRFDPLHRVCLIGSDGQVVKSFGSEKGSGNAQVNMPFYLAVDKNEFVYVDDLDNLRVLMLSPTLTYVREVVSRDQLTWQPIRLSLDVDRRRLYVADCEWKDGWQRYMAGRIVTACIH